MRATGKRNNSPPAIVAFKSSVTEIPIRFFGGAIYTLLSGKPDTKARTSISTVLIDRLNSIISKHVALVNDPWFARGSWKEKRLTEEDREAARMADEVIIEEGLR